MYKMVNDGYYRKAAYYDKPLKFCPYGSCGVITFKDGTIQLKSYTTIVIEISPDGWMVCSGTYSATTRKHIGAFLKEYAPQVNYYTMKQITADEMAYNMNTGEIKPLADYLK